MRRVVVCDIDGVVVKKETQLLFLIYLFRKGKVSLFCFARLILWFLFYKLHLTNDVDRVRAYAYKVFKGWSKKDFIAVCGDFFKRDIINEIREEILTDLREHHANGDVIVFVSATVEHIACQIRDYVGFGDIIATQLEDRLGILTGRISGFAVYGEEKVRAVDRFLQSNQLSWVGSYALADHISDLPLLHKVEHPIVVNPDKKLYVMAHSNGWLIWGRKNEIEET